MTRPFFLRGHAFLHHESCREITINTFWILKKKKKSVVSPAAALFTSLSAWILRHNNNNNNNNTRRRNFCNNHKLVWCDVTRQLINFNCFYSFIFEASYVFIQLIIIFRLLHRLPLCCSEWCSPLPHTSTTPSPPSFSSPPSIPLSVPSHIKTQDQESHPSYSRAQ